MPRYFFNTRIGQELIRDPVGEELRNADRAFEVAREMIREILKSEGASAALLSAVIEVTDVGNAVVQVAVTALRSVIAPRSETKQGLPAMLTPCWVTVPPPV